MAGIRTLLAAIGVAAALLAAPAPGEAIEPQAHVYARRGDQALTAYVFTPERPVENAAAVLIFHGGGWSMGSAEWGFGRARHFAGLGLVAIAVQYRLSGSEHPGVTPIEAMADARDAICWARSKRADLGIDPERIAAYGWSAGAHLAAMAAISPREDASGEDRPKEPACAPDALILVSPAVSLHHDAWLKRILGDRASVADISPDVHVRDGMPPTLLLQGRSDTVTPLEGTRRFHEAMLAAGNRSELIVYDGVGHLFTPSSEPDDGWPNPDPAVRAAAYDAADAFLRSLGYIARETEGAKGDR